MISLKEYEPAWKFKKKMLGTQQISESESFTDEGSKLSDGSSDSVVLASNLRREGEERKNTEISSLELERARFRLR